MRPLLPRAPFLIAILAISVLPRDRGCLPAMATNSSRRSQLAPHARDPAPRCACRAHARRPQLRAGLAPAGAARRMDRHPARQRQLGPRRDRAVAAFRAETPARHHRAAMVVRRRAADGRLLLTARDAARTRRSHGRLPAPAGAQPCCTGSRAARPTSTRWWRWTAAPRARCSATSSPIPEACPPTSHEPRDRARPLRRLSLCRNAVVAVLRRRRPQSRARRLSGDAPQPAVAAGQGRKGRSSSEDSGGDHGGFHRRGQNVEGALDWFLGAR